MNVFDLRNRLVSDYQSYTRSLIKIRDPRIVEHVDHALDAGAFRYTHLSFADNRLVGALVIGRTDHIGAIRGLIQCRTPLGAWKARLMRDPTRIAEAFVSHVS